MEELVLTDLMYKQTPYASNMEIGLRDIACTLKAEYSLPWNIVWKHVKALAPLAIKAATMRTSGFSFDIDSVPTIEDELSAAHALLKLQYGSTSAAPVSQPSA